MKSDVRIIEKEKPKEETTTILAFPDVGLVGLISVKHMIKELEMDEIGHIASSEFPPVTVIHDYRPSHPIRIYGNENLSLITSEIPIGSDLINPLTESLANWVEEIKSEKTLILGGLPHQNRTEIEKPEIHGVPTNENLENLLEEKNYHILQEGFITGINGVILLKLWEKQLPGMYLMSEAHRNYPDPGAAASLLEAINDLEGLKIDVAELQKQEEEIKVAARDLMRQTQKTMQNTAKSQEEEMPIMYG